MLCSRCQIAAAAACLACKQPLQNPAFKTYQGASPLPFLFCSADANKDVSFTMPTLNWIGKEKGTESPLGCALPDTGKAIHLQRGSIR